MKSTMICLIILTVSFSFLITKAIAGSSADISVRRFPEKQTSGFADKVKAVLLSEGAQVALVARVGRDRDNLPQGVSYTHVAFAVNSKLIDQNDIIDGYRMYNLYQREKEPDTSYLVQDSLNDFFAAVEVIEAGVIIPNPELQNKLWKVINSSTYTNLHNPSYSVIANPFSLELQNCTEHTLDVIFAALFQTDDELIIKEKERLLFKPQKVNINKLILTLGSLFAAGVAMADHTVDPMTATFTTIGKFMQEQGHSKKLITVFPDIEQ